MRREKKTKNNNNRLYLQRLVPILLKNWHLMQLDLVFLKSNVSLVSTKKKLNKWRKTMSFMFVLPHSWICDEGIFRWLDISDEKYRLGKVTIETCCYRLGT